MSMACMKARSASLGKGGSRLEMCIRDRLEALQGQLDVQNAALAELQGQSATLEEIEKQIADLRCV